MSRSPRKLAVLLLILVWNSAGVYAAACSLHCADAEFARPAAPTSLAAPSTAELVHSGTATDPAGPADDCPGSLHARKCVTELFQTPQQGWFYSQTPLVDGSVPPAHAAPACMGFHTLSPPGSLSRRLIFRKHPLLRI